MKMSADENLESKHKWCMSSWSQHHCHGDPIGGRAVEWPAMEVFFLLSLPFLLFFLFVFAEEDDNSWTIQMHVGKNIHGPEAFTVKVLVHARLREAAYSN